MGYYSAIKRNEISPLATIWRDLAGIILSEMRQRQIPHNFTHVGSTEQNKRTNKTETNSDAENNLMVARVARWEGIWATGEKGEGTEK